MGIVPSAKSLYLCSDLVGYENGKVDLFGLFNAIRPTSGYPCVKDKFCVFAQLVNDLGEVPFRVDIRFTANDEIVHSTSLHVLRFASRTILRQMAMRIPFVRFPRPGLYIVESICDNAWVCDAPLELL